MQDLTVIFYTANRIKPGFLKVVIDKLKKAAGDSPIVSVSQKPLNLGKNICVGDLGQNVWNIYHQMLVGAKQAETKYVATAEDDCLYSRSHYHTLLPNDDEFTYNLNRWTMFTWKPPKFCFRNLRLLADQLICNRELLIDTLEERFAKYPSYISLGWKERLFGEPGRKEHHLGLAPRKTATFWSTVPNIRFCHEDSIGVLSQGKRKSSGPSQEDYLPEWGEAKQVLGWYRHA